MKSRRVRRVRRVRSVRRGGSKIDDATPLGGRRCRVRRGGINRDMYIHYGDPL